VIRTLPLPLRNRLAATILEAVSDARARRVLAAVAEAPDTWLGVDERDWAALLAARARRASDALATLPPATRRGLDAVLDAAARLYEAGLYFEVHEWLEPHWMAARGETREALQGVIQAAVGWQHLANDNVAGARSLLVEGATRLRGRRLGARDFDGFARATAAASARVPSATPPAFPRRDASEREESV
jgi:predicted metal-dependent hydrolase